MSEGTTDFGSFVGYRQMIIELTSNLRKLKEHCEYLKLDSCNKQIDEVLKRIANDSFDIAIVGEFKRGKSTLINALLGKDVLPTDILPCSATLNRITYSVSPLVKIEYKDGKSEEISIDKLPEYVTKLTDESAKMSESVKEATVCYPINYCKNGVDIIDTPGLNDDKNMTDVTMSVLPQVDAAVLVIMAQSPFSEYERDFLENKLLTSDLGRVLFVVTGIDRCDEDEVDRVLKSISDRIQKYVLQKASKTLGVDSEEYAVYRRKLGKPKVFGISAKQALKSKIKGDEALLEKSNFKNFEKELERFLTEDRGAVVLQVPVNRILSSSAEILKMIEMQENIISMRKEEFKEKYDNAIEEIKGLREKKKDELSKINISAENTFNNLQPLLNGFWPAIQEDAMKIIDEFNVTNDDVKKNNIESTQQQILSKVTDSAKRVGQNYSERIQVEIERALSKETERLQGYTVEMSDTLDRIHNIFMDSNAGKDLVVEGIVSSAICSFIAPGFAGVWTGYRIAGIKGALVGGITGFGGAVGVGTLILALGIPLAWPALLAMSVASVFTGNWLTKKIFAKDEIQKFKDGIKDAVVKQFDEMKYQGNFVKSVHEQINSAFDALKEKIEDETEAVLEDTQKTLDDLKIKIERETIMTDKEKEELKEVAVSTAKIMETACKVTEQLNAVLDK